MASLSANLIFNDINEKIKLAPPSHQHAIHQFALMAPSPPPDLAAVVIGAREQLDGEAQLRKLRHQGLAIRVRPWRLRPGVPCPASASPAPALRVAHGALKHAPWSSPTPAKGAETPVGDPRRQGLRGAGVL